MIFIDASREFHEGKNQNSLRPQDIDHIHGAYTAAVAQQADEDKYCRVVDMDEIATNDYNLNIARYIDTSEPEEQVDIPAVLTELAELDRQISTVNDELNDYLKELGLLASAEVA